MRKLHTKSFISRLEEVQQQTQEPANKRSLANRVSEWLHHLPKNQRQAQYTMDQLTGLFDTSPQALGSILLLLGWVRRRSWAADKPYSRFWVPPGGF